MKIIIDELLYNGNYYQKLPMALVSIEVVFPAALGVAAGPLLLVAARAFRFAPAAAPEYPVAAPVVAVVAIGTESMGNMPRLSEDLLKIPARGSPCSAAEAAAAPGGLGTGISSRPPATIGCNTSASEW